MATTGGFKPVPGAFTAILKTDPRADLVTKAAAEKIVAAALADFNRQERHDNEWRTSEFTPPKYAESFGIRRVHSEHGVKYEAYNDDPGAILVEYGAHAGGRTFVLRYKPLTHGLEITGTAEA